METFGIKSRPSKGKTPYIPLLILAMMLTLGVGWMLTDFLGRVAETEFKEGCQREATLADSFLRGEANSVTSAAKSLGQADAIVAALASGRSVDLDRANSLLDRINSNFGMSVCYLLDRNGLTIASSNREEKSGFVGASFATRPYFTGAMTGRLTTYFALGKITHERGYYASIPTFGSAGTITGVVVVKRNVAPVEEYFSKLPHVYLVSPEGIIFISSTEEHLFRSLWPVDEKKRPELLASGQFGIISFEPVLDAEPRTGTYVNFNNEDHYVQRLSFGSEGWSLVFMEPPHIVSSYRLFGILLTTVFAFLLLHFFFVLRYKNKALEMARDLLRSRDDWKRTFDAVPDLIATLDVNHRIISINRAMAERLGLSPQEAVGRRCHELVHGSPEILPACPHRRAFGSGETEEETLFDMPLNGDFVVTATPLLAADGTVESTIHVMHDISELKKMEQTLKEYAQRLEFVLEGSNDATWEWDIMTDRAILNSRYFEMIEESAGKMEITYDFFLETIHPEDVSDVRRRVKDHLEGKTCEYEAHYRMVTRSGKIKNVLGRGKIVRYDEDGRPTRMAGVITDISEMKRLSDEVNRISNLESIGLLSGGLAHDFNNVLNIIYGNITFAKMLAGGDATIAESLTDAEDACERAKELGIRLQAFAEGGSPARETIMLPAIMEDAAKILFNDLQISHTIFSADDVLPVEAAPRQIRQVFENLLTNAKEAMSAGGTVKINIENYEFDSKRGLPLGPGRYVCVTVKDDGKGIPEENLSKIFDPYFSTKDIYSQRGLGLGLSICHAILKRHDGHISVDSESDIGTRVTLYLPAAVAGGGFTDGIFLSGSR